MHAASLASTADKACLSYACGIHATGVHVRLTEKPYGMTQPLCPGFCKIIDLVKLLLLKTSCFVMHVQWNDFISSVRVPAGLSVLLREHPNYGGRGLIINGPSDIPCLSIWDMNDVTSSMRITVGK
jgi:hypothetical protein